MAVYSGKFLDVPHTPATIAHVEHQAEVFPESVIAGSLTPVDILPPVGADDEVSVSYRNRVWDTQVVGSDKHHYWVTDEPDTSGTSYDGPGTWGVHTSDFCAVEIC